VFQCAADTRDGIGAIRVIPARFSIGAVTTGTSRQTWPVIIAVTAAVTIAVLAGVVTAQHHGWLERHHPPGSPTGDRLK